MRMLFIWNNKFEYVEVLLLSHHSSHLKLSKDPLVSDAILRATQFEMIKKILISCDTFS